MAKVTTDARLSKRYLASLRRYTDANLLTPTRRFCCADAKDCRASLRAGHEFAAGQMSYVGPHYAAAVGRNVAQILVVSMQTGAADARVSLEERSRRVRLRIDPPRNAHMRGVTLALQVLWGLPPRPDSEYLPDVGVHVLDAYAMANASLCSNLPTGGASRRGAPTLTMLKNCGRHLQATIDRLEPTIIVSQGWTAGPPSTYHAVEWIADEIEPVGSNVAWVRIGSVEAVWCSLTHPSAGPFEGWGSPTLPYFRTVAARALRKTRRLAGMG